MNTRTIEHIEKLTQHVNTMEKEIMSKKVLNDKPVEESAGVMVWKRCYGKILYSVRS